MTVPQGGNTISRHKNNQINQVKELLIFPGCGCYCSPCLGGKHGWANGAESGQEALSDAWPIRAALATVGERGRRSRRVTQAP